MTNNNAIRKSQRQPLACRHCTRAKLRCSKDIPCTRCRTKGLVCSREAVIVAARNSKITQDHERSSEQPGQSYTTYAGHDEINAHPSGLNSPQLVSNNGPPALRTPPAATSTSPQFEDLPTAIEGLAWGRHQCHQYPHTGCRRPMNPALVPEQYFISDDVLTMLPNLATSRLLVEFHLEQLAWYHNTIHVPTFMACCEAFWQSGVMPDPQWLPLYLSVLSASMWTLTNSPPHDGSSKMTPKSCQAMFELTTTQVFQTNSLGRHTTYSVQAICICAMIGNVLDSSDQMTVLVNAAIRIAQCLGLHRIPDEPEGSIDWPTTVHREVGRRIWWKLVELDYHSMPYTGTLSIHQASFTTTLPRNCHDEDLIEQPASVLTLGSCANVMAKIAQLMPSILEQMYIAEDDATKYQAVLEADRRMRQLMGALPGVVLRAQDPALESKASWIHTARRTLAISAADKIIMIHRPFILKSFQSPLYLFTRRTCVSAAMTILREHELAVKDDDCTPLWVHSAFAVTAVVVLCLNMTYADGNVVQSSSDLEAQRSLIQKARDRLARQKADSLARRGVYLIDVLLNGSHVTLGTSQAFELSLDDVLSSFYELERQDQTRGRDTERLEPDFQPDLSDETPDFDQWFSAVFA